MIIDGVDIGGTVPLVAVFDTNIYVGVGASRLAGIAEREASAHVLALASVWTCLESLGKCLSVDDRRAGQRFAALQKILRHAGYHDESGQLRLPPHSNRWWPRAHRSPSH